jgi:hypothetical protein
MGAPAYAYKPQLEPRIGFADCISRRRRRRVARAAGVARVASVCVVPLVLVLVYVGLMAELTTQTYRLAADQRVHAALADRNAALRSREAQLESVQNLQAAARRLHMGDPRSVAFIWPPAKAAPRAGRPLALFVQILGVTRWLGVR